MSLSTVNKEIVQDFAHLAIRHKKRMRIAYVDKSGGTEVRIIEPFVLSNDKILSGFCHLRKAPRHFSLDRIARVLLMDEDATEQNPFKKTEEEQKND